MSNHWGIFPPQENEDTHTTCVWMFIIMFTIYMNVYYYVNAGINESCGCSELCLPGAHKGRDLHRSYFRRGLYVLWKLDMRTAACFSHMAGEDTPPNLVALNSKGLWLWDPWAIAHDISWGHSCSCICRHMVGSIFPKALYPPLSVAW